MDAVVYTSQTGYTAEYARMLGEKTGLKVYSMREARERLPQGAEIVYMGWMMAGTVRGCADAMKRYRVRVVCGVGVGEDGSQVDVVRKANKLPESMPVFTLQGGFAMERLRGGSRLIMKIMKNALIKQMESEADRTPGTEAAIHLLRNGGSCVREQALEPVLEAMK